MCYRFRFSNLTKGVLVSLMEIPETTGITHDDPESEMRFYRDP
jgi:hypothetical protein